MGFSLDSMAEVGSTIVPQVNDLLHVGGELPARQGPDCVGSPNWFVIRPRVPGSKLRNSPPGDWAEHPDASDWLTIPPRDSE